LQTQNARAPMVMTLPAMVTDSRLGQRKKA
jgi:hypothetical protein